MEGGVSRRRGYWILTAALLLAVVALLCFPRSPKPTDQGELVLAEIDSLAQWEQEAEHAQQSAHHYKRWPQRSHYTHSERSAEIRSEKSAEMPAWVIDINHADSAELTKLYGIGPVLARRIVKYRSVLGGFINVNQIKEVYGFDTVYFQDIVPHVSVDTAAVRKIDINSASVGELARHPYLDSYQAKAIVRLRQRGGDFATVGDLMGVPIIDTQTFNKIAPYLICSLQPSK